MLAGAARLRDPMFRHGVVAAGAGLPTVVLATTTGALIGTGALTTLSVVLPTLAALAPRFVIARSGGGSPRSRSQMVPRSN